MEESLRLCPSDVSTSFGMTINPPNPPFNKVRAICLPPLFQRGGWEGLKKPCYSDPFNKSKIVIPTAVEESLRLCPSDALIGFFMTMKGLTIINIFEANDIVFSGVTSGLYFDQFQVDFSRIFQTMFSDGWDKSAFVFTQIDFVFAV